MKSNEFVKLLQEVNWNGSKLEKGLTVGGSLDLRGTAITSLPDNLTVGGSLDLEGIAITSLPDNLTVGGSLDLRGTAITSLPDNLTVGGSLDLRGTAITSLPDNLTVGGSLYLRDTAITSLPDNLTVGGSLDLEGTAITSLPDNLTVGGSLDLEGIAITSLPDNLTVGGSLYLRGTAIKDTSRVKQLKQGDKSDKWIYADGSIMHVQKVKKLNDITIYISPYNSTLATKDHQTFAHGKDIRSAIQDLNFKLAKRNVEDYRDLSLDTELKFDDAVVMYRVITGSCQYGTQQFIDEHPELAKKKTITISEIIEMTKGSYGSKQFAEFFII